MALSVKCKKRIEVALARRVEANELIAAVESGSNPVAAVVSAIGVTVNLTAPAVAPAVIVNSNFTAANATEPTKAEIDVGIDTLRTAVVGVLDVKADNADLSTLKGEVEVRMGAVEAKIDAVIAALKAAGLMHV